MMTQEQFARYSYRHSEIMILHSRHPEIDIEMMLIGVDFDGGLFHLVPFDLDYYEDKDYWYHYKFVDKKTVKPKMNVRYGTIKKKEMKQ